MKKLLGLAVMAASFGFMTFAFAAPTTTVRGYIMDKNCSTNAAMKGNVACAKTCIGKGIAAVLVEDKDGTVLTIANKDAILSVAGQHVTMTGTVDNGTITVTKVKVSAAPKSA